MDEECVKFFEKFSTGLVRKSFEIILANIPLSHQSRCNIAVSPKNVRSCVLMCLLKNYRLSH